MLQQKQDPTTVISHRRPLPFVVPPDMEKHPTVVAYDGLVQKREAHIDVLERQMLSARDAVIAELGTAHPMVAKMNDFLQKQSALWTA